MPSNKDVIAVTDTVKEAGAVVWWTLSGAINLDKLVAAWTAAGLDPVLLPEAHGPEVALHRATEEQRERHRLVRRMPNKKGWLIVDEQKAGEEDCTYDVSCKLRLNAVGRPVLEHDGTEAAVKLADEVRAAFNRHLDELSSNDIGSWLVHLAYWTKGIALRSGGGLYYVPRKQLDTWKAMAEVVERVSGHKLWLIRAMRGSEAVACVLDAVRTEAAARVKEMSEELAAGKLGATGLSNRVERCEQFKDVLAQYDELLGDQLDGIRADFGKLRSRLAAAVLVASGDEQAA